MLPFLTTGGDVPALLLQLANLAIAAAIWWPFLRAYDRTLLAREPAPAAAEAASREAA